MQKLSKVHKRAAIVLTVAAAAMSGSAVSVAGPGCMGNPQRHASPAYHGYGPMMPHSTYRPGPRVAHRGAPPPYLYAMPAPYKPPMGAQPYSPGAVARPAAPAAVDKVPADASLHAAGDTSEPAGDNVTVRIDGMRFEPSSITVKPGDTVTWIHGSSMPHTITGNADGPRSSTLYSGQQYSHTFDTQGRYDYACDFHPSMKGSVTVEASGTDT